MKHKLIAGVSIIIFSSFCLFADDFKVIKTPVPDVEVLADADGNMRAKIVCTDTTKTIADHLDLLRDATISACDEKRAASLKNAWAATLCSIHRDVMQSFQKGQTVTFDVDFDNDRINTRFRGPTESHNTDLVTTFTPYGAPISKGSITSIYPDETVTNPVTLSIKKDGWIVGELGSKPVAIGFRHLPTTELIYDGDILPDNTVVTSAVR